MDKIDPLVSVIIPVYNSFNFIEECLLSLSSQDYENVEFLVSDDSSSDETREVLAKFEDDRRFKIFYQESNLGITDNCNFLIEKASGKYVCFFAGDDVMLPGKIRKQVSFMEANSSLSFCYHPAKIFSTEENRVLMVTDQDHRKLITNTSSLIEQMGIPASMSIMARKEFIPETGFNRNYRYVSDWLMQIEMSLKGGVGFIDEPLCLYRKYGANNGKSIASYEYEFTNLLNELSINYPRYRSSVEIGLSRYLLGKFFRAETRLEKRIIISERMEVDKSPLSKLLYIASFVPSSGAFFNFLYRKRFFLKKLYE